MIVGIDHWQNMSKAASSEAKIVYKKSLSKENEERKFLIDSLNPKNNKTQSIIDFLRYRALTQGHAVISVLGSDVVNNSGVSNISNSWSELLKSKLKFDYKELEMLTMNIHGNAGYSTSDLVKSGKIAQILQNQPDLIIFETPLINNFEQSISIEKTNNDLNQIMSSLQKELPDAKIIIMFPNPITNNENKNLLNLKYLDYIRESGKMIRQNRWPYVNSIEEIEKKLKHENSLLVDILTKEYYYLNDEGNVLWFEFLYEYLKQKK